MGMRDNGPPPTPLKVFVLVVTRKGDVEETLVSADQARLKQRADVLDGGRLSWQNFYGTIGAHATNDEEKTYTIYPAEVI